MSVEELRRQHPILNFELNNDSVVCIVNGFAFGVLNSDGSINNDGIESLKRMQTFFSRQEELIGKGKKGNYAIVRPDLSVAISPTEGGALTYAQQFNGKAFVHRIGDSKHDLLLGLHPDDLPVGFDTLFPLTEVPDKMHSVYRNTNRRWICASLRLANGKYRKTWALVDTGATTCYLCPEHRQGVSKLDLFTVGGDLLFEGEFLGCPVRFRASEEAANSNITNINLVGASFLNQFLLIDDFLSGYLMLTKRTDGPIELV